MTVRYVVADIGSGTKLYRETIAYKRSSVAFARYRCPITIKSLKMALRSANSYSTIYRPAPLPSSCKLDALGEYPFYRDFVPTDPITTATNYWDASGELRNQQNVYTTFGTFTGTLSGTFSDTTFGHKVYFMTDETEADALYAYLSSVIGATIPITFYDNFEATYSSIVDPTEGVDVEEAFGMVVINRPAGTFTYDANLSVTSGWMQRAMYIEDAYNDANKFACLFYPDGSGANLHAQRTPNW